LVYEALIPLVLVVAGISLMLSLLDKRLSVFISPEIEASPKDLLFKIPLLLLGIILFGDNALTAIKRMIFVGNTAKFPGWDWPKLASIIDIAGLTSPITHAQALKLGMLELPVEIFFFALCLIGLRRIKFSAELTLPFLYCLALYLYSCLHIWKGSPNASHMVAKALATMAPLVMACLYLGLTSILRNIRGRDLSLVASVFILVCQFRNISNVYAQQPVVSARQDEKLAFWAANKYSIKFGSKYRDLFVVRMLFGPSVKNDLLLNSFTEKANCKVCPSFETNSAWICLLPDTVDLYNPKFMARECTAEGKVDREILF